jgi:hypothetical protein
MQQPPNASAEPAISAGFDIRLPRPEHVHGTEMRVAAKLHAEQPFPRADKLALPADELTITRNIKIRSRLAAISDFLLLAIDA